MEVSQTPDERGRIAIATMDLKPGALVTTEEPYAAVLYPEYTRSKCDFSFTSPSKLLRCSRCRVHHFASQAHQRMAWRMYYAKESAALLRYEPRSHLDVLRP